MNFNIAVKLSRITLKNVSSFNFPECRKKTTREQNHKNRKNLGQKFLHDLENLMQVEFKLVEKIIEKFEELLRDPFNDVLDILCIT